MRPHDEWGDIEHQRAFLAGLAGGRLDKVGGEPQWADRISFVPGTKLSRPVSSTRARAAATSDLESRRREDLEWLVPPRVREFLLSENPYISPKLG